MYGMETPPEHSDHQPPYAQSLIHDSSLGRDWLDHWHLQGQRFPSATGSAQATTAQHSSPPEAPFALVRSLNEQISSLRRLDVAALGCMTDLESSMPPVASDHAITVPLGENRFALIGEYREWLEEKLDRLESADETCVA